jgi:hypothetical protein
VSELRAADVDEGPPPPVFLALIGSYALALTLLLLGFLGFLTWAAVGDVVGVGATILGLLLLGASYIAWRGSRAGRALIGLLAAIGAVAGTIYIFAGPSSAIISSLIVAGLGAATVALLYLPESSKRFYSTA